MATTTIRSDDDRDQRCDRPPAQHALAGAAFSIAVLAAGGLGSAATSGSVESTWFETLEKPPAYPPSWAFGVVWTILYAAIAMAGYLAWRAGAGRRALGWWVAQVALNLAWSVVFFGLRSPGWALVVMAGLWLSIAMTIVRFWAVDRVAAWLMVPYLTWVSFAAYLNVGVVVLA